MRKISFLIIISLLIAGCSSEIPYRSDYPLSAQYFRSSDGVFYGNIPIGWFDARGDTLGESLVVWLLKEDFSSAITVRELKLDHFTSDKIADEGLIFLAKLDLSSLDKDSSTVAKEPIVFKQRGKEFCSYEIISSSGGKRVVIFEAKRHFYISDAFMLKNLPDGEGSVGLYNVQQSVLGSVGY